MWFGKLESSVETGRLLSVALSIKNISERFYLDVLQDGANSFPPGSISGFRRSFTVWTYI